MIRLRLSVATPLMLAALASGTVACGAKGDDDTATGGTGGTSSTETGSTSSSMAGTGSSVGGTTGMAGTASTVTQKWGFDMDQESWDHQYASSGKEADGTTAVPIFDMSDVKVNWASNKGDGDEMGCLQADIPYTNARQYAGIGIHLNGADVSGKLITARVKLDTGLEDTADLSTYSPGAKLYLKSGTAYTYAAGNYTSITSAGTWYTLKFNLADPNSWSYVDTTNGTFDPTEIGELGIQFDSPDSLDAKPMAASVLIDNVQY